MEKNEWAQVILIRNRPEKFNKGIGMYKFSTGLEFPILLKAAKAQNWELIRRYHSEFAMMVMRLHRSRRTVITCMDGLTQGAGATLGASVNTRVATQYSTFSSRETAEGRVPECGSSYVLSRMPGNVGTFLALTGAEIHDFDLVHTGLANAFWTRAGIEAFEEEFNHQWGIAEATQSLLAATNSAGLAAGQRAFTLAPHWDVIDSCFGQETVEDIVAALERKAAQGFDLAHSALEQLKKRSPLVLKLTLRQLSEAKKRTLLECLQLDWTIAANLFRNPNSDLQRQRAPWSYASLEQVRDEEVARHFALPEGEKPLDVHDPLDARIKEKQEARKWWGEWVYPQGHVDQRPAALV